MSEVIAICPNHNHCKDKDCKHKSPHSVTISCIGFRLPKTHCGRCVPYRPRDIPTDIPL